MKDNHKWRPGERVVSLLYGERHFGKPARLVKFAYSYGFSEADTYFKLEEEETGEEFFAPIIALESLEERPEEEYKPTENMRLRSQCKNLFDSDGNLIQRKRGQYYGY